MNLLNSLNPDLKKQLQETIEGIINKVENEIPSYKKQMEQSINKQVDNELVYHFANVPLLIRLSILDLAILFKSFFEAKTESEENMFARLLCSQLYEYIEDTPVILGKKYRRIITDLNESKLIDELNSLSKSLNDKKLLHHSFLKKVRNNISSHKDSDGMLQAKLIVDLNMQDVAISFLEITSSFAKYLSFEKMLIKHLRILYTT